MSMAKEAARIQFAVVLKYSESIFLHCVRINILPSEEFKSAFHGPFTHNVMNTKDRNTKPEYFPSRFSVLALYCIHRGRDNKVVPVKMCLFTKQSLAV